jgi:hypothetical protein
MPRCSEGPQRCLDLGTVGAGRVPPQDEVENHADESCAYRHEDRVGASIAELNYFKVRLTYCRCRCARNKQTRDEIRIHICDLAALRDAEAGRHDMLRIVDESGEDYLYPKASFRPIALPQAVRRAILAA